MTVKYARLPEVLAELAVARANNKYEKVLKSYKTVQLLILDDWLIMPLSGVQAMDLFELVEKRYHTGSTIFCSQFDVPGWHEKIGNPTIADAIIDRIVHDSYKIVIGGLKSESMRKRKGLKLNNADSVV